MNVIQYLDHPRLKNFVKKVSPGQYLFKQGEAGSTMFIIADGIVHLISERNGDEHVAMVLERGQFLGERAVMRDSSHKRFFSARAKTHAQVLELTRADLESLEKSDPDVIIDMLKQIFEVAAHRLELSNYMGTLLRSSNNFERLVHLILYFCKSSGRKVPEGVEVLLSVESIHSHLDMPPDQINACIQDLLAKKLLISKVNQYFVVPNEEKIIQYIPTLTQTHQVEFSIGKPQKRKLFSFG